MPTARNIVVGNNVEDSKGLTKCIAKIREQYYTNLTQVSAG